MSKETEMMITSTDICSSLRLKALRPGAHMNRLYLSAASYLPIFAAVALTCLLVIAWLGASRAGAVPFQIENFTGGVFEQSGPPETRAGAHPWTGSARFELNQGTDPSGTVKPIGTLRNTFTDIPPGLVGNPQAVPACPGSTPIVEAKCPNDTQVGYATTLTPAGTPASYFPVYNMNPPEGVAALFKFTVAGAPVLIVAKLRTGGDYGVSLETRNAPQTASIFGVNFVLWGVPASPAHDSERGFTSASGVFPCANPANSPSCSNPVSIPVKPFISLPTSCPGTEDVTAFTIETWEGEEDSAEFKTPPVTACNALDFSPTLEARPTTNVADSPSGFDVTLHIPQNEDPSGVAEAHLRDTVVTLPEGLTVNPSSANGLDGCSPAEVDLEGEGPAQCPDASKLGIVEVETPVLDHPVPGAVYIADPYDNPFESLLALYIAIDDPESGIVVKLAGEVEIGGEEFADPELKPGQLRAYFEENPQLPFEDFNLKFFGGAHGSLRTPAICGDYTTSSELTPWSAPDSGPPATPSDTWAIERAPGGGTCPKTLGELPNSPTLDAGTVAPIAAAHTPLVVNLRRQDGTQQFRSITLTPPQGLVGKLAGIPYCPEAALAAAAAKSGRAEEASPSCPAASYVGSVTAAAGAGPAPYYAPGKAYLTGPYKGAPLSLAVIAPATAGPFDLGTIVVRTALYVDRRTAQITAVSDPIPTILQGIPLDVRSIQVRMDRPDFIINPTSCDPTTFGGQLLSTLGQTAPLQSRFQVGECGQLGFAPKLSLRLKGSTRRTGHPALSATLTMPEGGANMAAVSVALPHSEFLDQSHIGTICTRVQFAADTCPAESIYGTATATSPLLDYPLTGNVYLRSSSNPLPNLVIDLRGPAHQPIKIEADGRVDSVKGGIRNTFDFIPDAPVSSFTLQMQGGKKGLLENSTNLCRKTHRATVEYTSHNGEMIVARPPLKAQCGKAKKSMKRGKRSAHRRSP